MTPRLSQSTANVLLNLSPAHAYASCSQLGGGKKKSSAALDKGSLIDALLLPDGAKRVVVLDFDNYKKDAAQKAKADVEAAGEIPILREKYEDALKVVDILHMKIREKGIKLEGESHYKVEWTQPDTGVLCRGELDHVVLYPTVAEVFDIKTAASAKPEAFVKSVGSFGFDVQETAYTEAIEVRVPKLVGRVRFTFVVAEIEPPYAVTPITLDGQFKAIGRAKWLAACRRWQECLKTGVWPDYGSAIVSPKPWQLTEALGLEGVSELVIEPNL